MPDKKKRGHAESTTAKRRTQGGDELKWTLCPTDSDYPVRLSDQRLAQDWKQIYGIGNRDILKRSWLGLICSIQCPGSVVIRTFDAIRELRDAGIVVAGGFHSPMEKECLDFLLRGEQPVVVCPAKHPTMERVPVAWRTPLDEGRLLLLSPFPAHIRRTTTEHAQTRNEFVAAMSDTVFVPHASPVGKTKFFAVQLLKAGKTVITISDESNADLVVANAMPFEARTPQLLSGVKIR